MTNISMCSIMLLSKKARNYDFKKIYGEGGVILFGIDDLKNEVGLSDVRKDSEKICELINSKIEPLPRYNIKTFEEDGKNFLEVKIGDGPKTPYYYVNEKNKTAYIRKGSETKEAPKFVLDNLILKGENLTYDELPTKYKLDDLSFTLLSATLKKESGSELDIPKECISMNLILDDFTVTNAGLLFSDQGILPQSKVFCTRWNGLTKTGLKIDALDDKEYSGSIISLLENAEAFIRNNSKCSWEVVGLKRIEKEEYPIKAVREAIVNALMHRDYQIIGSEIHIDMFSDRLVITSPGGMIDGNNVQDLNIMQIASMRRNRVLSDIFSRLHFMDRRGSGLMRILSSYEDYPIKPLFYSNNSIFSVTFPNKGNQIENNETQNLVNDNDYFLINLYKKISNIQPKTYEQILKIFDSYNYNHEFKREDIIKLLDIKNTRASELIALLLKYELIIQTKKTNYIFFK